MRLDVTYVWSAVCTTHRWNHLIYTHPFSFNTHMKNVNRSKRTNKKNNEVTTIEASGQCICPTENAICTSTLGSVAKLTSQHAMDYRMSEMRQTDSLKELKYSNNPLLAKWLFMQSFDRSDCAYFSTSSSYSCCKFGFCSVLVLFLSLAHSPIHSVFCLCQTDTGQLNWHNRSIYIHWLPSIAQATNINITHHITSQMYVLCVHNSVMLFWMCAMPAQMRLIFFLLPFHCVTFHFISNQLTEWESCTKILNGKTAKTKWNKTIIKRKNILAATTTKLRDSWRG